MGELHPVPKGAAGGDYWILEGDTTDADSKVNWGGPLRAACRRRRTHGPKLTMTALYLSARFSRQAPGRAGRETSFGVVAACVRMCADAGRRKKTIALCRRD
jgi:hypothetical protein